MTTYRLTKTLWLPQPRETICDFFSNPGNLDRLTPAWLKFQILSPQSTLIKAGTVLDYRLRLRGIPIRWQSEISLWEPPRRFIDRQTKGPYSLWVHEHTFAEENGGTVVGDNVEYAAPGGSLVQKYLLAPDLERIFQHRHKVLEELFNPNHLARSKTGRD